MNDNIQANTNVSEELINTIEAKTNLSDEPTIEESKKVSPKPDEQINAQAIEIEKNCDEMLAYTNAKSKTFICIAYCLYILRHNILHFENTKRRIKSTRSCFF